MHENIALVTGGAAGLGEVIAHTLAADGAHVLVADRDPEAAADLIERLSGVGDGASFVETDASDPDQIRAMIDRAAELGQLRLLVNNAGGWLPGPQFPDTDAWGRSLDLNLRMPMLATKLALPLLGGGGGAVVNVSSSAGFEFGPYGSPEYAAAKAGLIRFTTAVADFADRFEVRVSCVVPHWIGLPRAVIEYTQMTPQKQKQSGGLIDPQVVATTILELAKDPDSAGRVVEVHATQPPYAVDPAPSTQPNSDRITAVPDPREPTT
ncbi:MAG: SDR family oxidoreductase [Propionibacteriaceae bacterium]|jgi:NAD(P)-dependent dehydrogenase (short-subunit alcohol dehydrogenase family)